LNLVGGLEAGGPGVEVGLAPAGLVKLELVRIGRRQRVQTRKQFPRQSRPGRRVQLWRCDRGFVDTRASVPFMRPLQPSRAAPAV